jgi:hypothetical protein
MRLSAPSEQQTFYGYTDFLRKSKAVIAKLVLRAQALKVFIRAQVPSRADLMAKLAQEH